MQEIRAYNKKAEPVNELVQWDKDVTIYLPITEGDNAGRVNFFNNTMTESFVVDSAQHLTSDKTSLLYNSILVKIPNGILTEPYAIIGYVNVDMGSETKALYCFKINVRRKPKPSNYVHDKSKDYIAVEAVLSDCQNYARNAQEAAEGVVDMANTSESFAVGGTGTRENEDTDNSKYYAEQANIFKENAAESQASALESKTAAEASAECAKSYAVGGTGTREDEDTDNARYYYEKVVENKETIDQKTTIVLEKAEETNEYFTGTKAYRDEVIAFKDNMVAATNSASEEAIKAAEAAGAAEAAAEAANNAAEYINQLTISKAPIKWGNLKDGII